MFASLWTKLKKRSGQPLTPAQAANRMWPSGRIRPMSPVWNHPSVSMARAVSSGRLYYPGVTMEPRTRISPGTDTGWSAPRLRIDDAHLVAGPAVHQGALGNGWAR